MVFFNIIKKFKIIFIFNEKCACTTIKNIICQLNGIKVKNFNDVDRMKFNNTNLESIIATYSDYNILFFYRNPYDRLISGYNKVLNKKILKLQFQKNKSVKKCTSILNNCNISFKEFVKIIISVNPIYLDTHFRHQTYNLEKLFTLKKNVLYNIENLINFEIFLKDEYNINVKLDIHDKYKWDRPEITKDFKDDIYKYFEQDFKLLKIPK